MVAPCAGLHITEATLHSTPLIRPTLVTDRLREASGVNVAMLKPAGLNDPPTAVITTNASDLNLYLPTELRNLRSALVLNSRSMYERNLAAQEILSALC